MANNKNITFDQLQAALSRVKNALDEKANTNHGNHVPNIETANGARFLRNDNTWQTITPVDIGAAAVGHNHTSLTDITKLQFAAAPTDYAAIRVTTESANTYLDFEMNDDSEADMYRWRFNSWLSNNNTESYFDLMTLTAKDGSSARLTVNGDVTASSFIGNASSATKLQTAKTLTIGNASRYFDGSANVTWSLSDIGAAADSHTHGSYTNQNAFTNVKIGDTIIEADSPTDTLTLNAGANVTITPDAINDAVTIEARDTIYTHPTNPGNRHIPSGGSSGQILRWSEDGTAAWGSENNTFTNGSVGGFTVTPNNLIGNNVGMTSASGYGFAFWAGANGADGSNEAPFRVGHTGELYAYKAVLAGTLEGNATTATKLQTARKFTIGNSEKYFDGTNNVSWTLDEIGAASSGHIHTNIKFQDRRDEDTTPNGASEGISLHLKLNGVAGLSDGGAYYSSLFLKPWNDLSGSPFANIAVTANHNIWLRTSASNDAWSDWRKVAFTTDSITGNAATATKLQTARTITIGNTGKSFDGSGNVSWSLDEIGAVSPSHTHDRIVGSMSNVTISQSDDRCGLEARNNVDIATWYGFSISNNCYNTDNYGQVTFSVDARSGQVWTRGTISAPTFSGALQGNATTATTLFNSRKFTIGNTEKYFNGSADVSWSLDEMGVTSAIAQKGDVILNTVNQQMNSAIDRAKSSVKMDMHHNYVSKHEAAHYFEGENKWKLDLYNMGSMDTMATPTKDLMIQHNCQYLYSILVEHPSYTSAYGDTYVGYATTYMHFTEDYQWTGQIATDDAGSVYLNDEFVLSTTSCQFKDITLNFRAGWNKLEVLYAEGGGGDGWQFNPEIIVVPGGILNKMNCYGQNSIGESLKENYLTKTETNDKINNIRISNAMIEDGAVTANKLGTIGGFQVEDRLLRGRNGTEGNNYVGMSGDGFGWAFWAGAYNGGDAPFHVGHEGHLYATNATLAGTLDGNATSATRLQTARSINGTSFNGTGDITTANWGTSRTLTIGNTGKSVNGSGNVSWSIDEIGALKASKIGAADANVLKTTGRYIINGTPANVPTDNHGVIDVIWDVGTPYQIFYPDNVNTAYKRTWNSTSGVWYDWTQLKFTDTWRGVQNNLTSDATDQSLSAAQGKALKGLIDGKAAASHTHNYAGSSSAGGNANAAVKLATARSINGTNFDGSGNITTTNWGTGRTITIGNTGKTVNGSGNVSWSLSEIGALPTAGGTVSGNLNVSGTFSIDNKKITINSSAPSNPAVGDIWIKI